MKTFLAISTGFLAGSIGGFVLAINLVAYQQQKQLQALEDLAIAAELDKLAQGEE